MRVHQPPAFILALILFAIRVSCDDYTCSASEPCASGCCGVGGYCGLGPTFCGAGNCTSSCDAKAECDPGWGSEWSSAETCPLNVCCSQYGFCGTTSEFCGDKKVTSPSCSSSDNSASSRVVGYYEGWSMSRACDQMYPEDIPIGAYTHLNYAFAYIDPNSYEVAPMSASDLDLYARFTALKESAPGLQTWISIGGWSMNDDGQPTAGTFSALAASSSAQKKFFASLLTFMTTYGFDGVDIDWEYPVAPERSGNPDDLENYPTFLKNLKNALGSSGHNYGLSITIPSSYWYMQNFDIVSIAKVIDWFNVMTYDLHGTWDASDPYIGSVIDAHTNLTEIDQTMDLLWRNNIDPAKVTLGLGFYGRSFTLTDPSCDTAGCAFSGGGLPGNCTANSGTLSFAEITEIIANSDAKITLNKDAAVKEVVWDTNQWVSYDDAETIGLKIEYASGKCLGGVMVWASSLDTSNGTAAAALSSSTGLEEKSLTKSSTVVDSITSCVWGECGADCPAGLRPAGTKGSSPGKNSVGIYSGCSGDQTRNYCCPSSDMPTCAWRGGAPFCNGKCHKGEVQVASDLSAGGATCITGHKVLCCTSNNADAASSECDWKGSAPFCAGAGKHASCPSGESALTWDAAGAGGEELCYIGSKSLCCPSPAPYTNCGWYGSNGLNLKLQLKCTQSCPAGKYPIATDPSWCDIGVNQYCCDVPTSLNDPQLNGFLTLVQTFANDPTCPSNILAKRSSGLTASNLAILAEELTAIFSNGAQTSLETAELQLYQQYLEPVFGASASDFAEYYGSFPGSDPNHLTSLLFCNGANVSTVIADQKADQDLCILPTDVSSEGCRLPRVHDEQKKKLRVHHGAVTTFEPDDVIRGAHHKVKRVISPSEESVVGPDQEPSIRALMEAVINGEMTFQYTDLVQIGDSNAAFDNMMGPSSQQQGILEIAWLMGENNNPANVNSNYQEFGGTDLTANPPPDMFFVMHFHVDHILYDGNTPYVGIYAIVAFHGQYINSRNRVDGNSVREGTSQRNLRTPLLQCPGYGGPTGTEPDRYVYPGWNVDSSSIMSTFLNHLANEGYLTRQTFVPIIRTINDPQNNCEFFDWEQVEGGTTGSLDANGNPYVRPNGF